MTESSDDTGAVQRDTSLSAVEAQLCASAQSTLRAALDDIIDTRIASLWAVTGDTAAQIYMTAPDRCEEFSELLTKLGFDDIEATHITDFSYLEFPIDTPNNLKAAKRLVETRYLADALEIAVDKGFGNTKEAYYRGSSLSSNWRCRYTEQGLCVCFAGLSDPGTKPAAALENNTRPPEYLETDRLLADIFDESANTPSASDISEFSWRVLRRYLDLPTNEAILKKAGFIPEHAIFNGIDALLVFPTPEHLAQAEIVFADAGSHNITNLPATYPDLEGEAQYLARQVLARTMVDIAATAATMADNQPPLHPKDALLTTEFAMMEMAVQTNPTRLREAVMELRRTIANAELSSNAPTNPFKYRDDRRR